ncbi:MAG: RelA/SpoT family protein [Nitrospinota bacterium]
MEAAVRAPAPIRIEDIIDRVASYDQGADETCIMRAYVFCAKVHRGQTRRSGEPYLTHPLEVARVLTDLRVDAETVAAGLLHDTVEDTRATLDEVRDLFGPHIADLVDGVTKISRLEFAGPQETQAENYRKMILAMVKDIRVLLIKLADRLHNMLTLAYLSPKKRIQVALETAQVYAPLANRLGIGWLKGQLEDEAFRYLNPDACRELEENLAAGYADRQVYIERIKGEVEALLREAGLEAEVKGRSKRISSIYRKMQTQNIDFHQVYDVMALRIICRTLPDCYAILGHIHAHWKPIPGRFKDYIALPRRNMYRSLHTTIMGPDGQRVEFQIRTDEMHRTAEHGIAAHWRYKEKGELGDRAEEQFTWLRQLMELQKEVQDPREFLSTVKLDLFQDEVYVFTPKGEVRAFPRGSTPVDFAYGIHTDIGDHCVGAKVNGRIVPLKYKLRNGDIVEIIASPNRTPSRDWLHFVVTSKARARIRAWVRSEQKERAAVLGREIVEREVGRYGGDPSEWLKGERLEAAAASLGFQEARELLASVGFGKLSPIQVAHRLLPREVVEAQRRKEASPLRRLIRRIGRHPREGGVKVRGHGDILVHFARCCSPVPGDSIVGFITRGRGLSIHTEDCPSVQALGEDAERRIEVEWEVDHEVTHPVYLVLETANRPGMLASVSAAIASCEANISKVEAQTGDGRAQIHIGLEIRNLPHLEQILRALRSIKGVYRAERVRAGEGSRRADGPELR